MPSGWLLDPNGKWLLLFRRDPFSLNNLPIFYTEKWQASSFGTPAKFQNRRAAPLQETIETWNELLQSGWINIRNKLGGEI